jgi:hypothetical protein
MATKKYYESDKITPRFENWEAPESGMPETDLGGSRAGIDEQIRKDNIKKSKIKPRGV